MDINLSIPTKSLTTLNQVDLLARIAGGMAREVQGRPENAIGSLLGAAALLARQDCAGPKSERLATLTDLLELMVTMVDLEAVEVDDRRI
ncbi:hypothetical protein LAZ40_07150 [Cereibacter sphaeroides]|uniref:hypothetical protein n=1 Tax=Cereibacter sphaeroides TaxID=1063 RepID=UPI001F40DD08|nr:hypothetical protein [Cereibacter sphaeroides]MCE6958824.1 hypothetical protein [Cereibacter sphaeroides]MCE6973302.1 hypothetical protein [Cereibacter sphaeroides]